MSYIPKYLMDRMFNAGGVEIDDTTLFITMTAMLRPIALEDIKDVRVTVFYQGLDTDDQSPTYNTMIEMTDLYTLKNADLVFRFGGTAYDVDTIDESTEVVNLGEQFTLRIPNIQNVTAETVGIFRVALKIYNPLILKFAKTVNIKI